jgi:hypothetical protein
MFEPLYTEQIDYVIVFQSNKRPFLKQVMLIKKYNY